ncbi:heat shock 70 domain protein, partial [Vibrio parahaemolyticus V-223/04]|jgi:hypothetical protein
VWI